jgi:hypothetical protein
MLARFAQLEEAYQNPNRNGWIMAENMDENMVEII